MNYYSSNNEFKHAVEQAATNRWLDIFQHFGFSVEPKKATACPACRQGDDRFTWDNKLGRGDFFCRKCGAGDGFQLIHLVTGRDFFEVLKSTADYLGVKHDFKAGQVKQTPSPIVGKWQSYWYKNGTRKSNKVPCYQDAMFDHIWKWTDKYWIGRGTLTNGDKFSNIIWYDPDKGLTIGDVGDNRIPFGDFAADTILLVEGEKCVATTIEKKCVPDGWNVCTWVGGCKATKYTDWSYFTGKNIFMWPDADDEGDAAMRDIAMRLREHAAKVYMIKPPTGRKKGWDIADAILDEKWDKAKIVDYIKSFCYEPKFESTDDIIKVIEAGIKPLGTDDKQCVIMPSTQKRILHYSPSEFTQNNLEFLQPVSFWKLNPDFLTKDKKLDYPAIAKWIIAACRDKGIYNAKNIRGTGCWFDAGRSILHAGNKLVVDGLDRSLLDLESKYIYERHSDIPVDLTNPLNEKEIRELYDIVHDFKWRYPLAGHILFSFIMLAPICGVLDWRPHAWLLGEAGSGKTVIIELLLFCLEGICIPAEGGTTEPGLRGELGNNSWPVVFEEAEGEDKISRDTMQRNLRLVRQSSSKVKTRIIKGTSGGGTVSSEIKSMFCFASTDCIVTRKPDRDRISILHLEKSNDVEHWIELEKKLLKWQAKENIPEKLLSYSYSAIATVKHNAKLFSNILAETYDKRFGDQYGTWVAGEFLSQGINQLDEEQARAYLSDFDFTPFVQATEISQEEKVLDFLLQSLITVEVGGARTSITIGAAIEKLLSLKEGVNDNFGIWDEQLGYYGIKKIMQENEAYIAFATSSKQITTILRDISSENWNQLLERIHGAIRSDNSIHFGHGLRKSRAVLLPASTFLTSS